MLPSIICNWATYQRVSKSNWLGHAGLEQKFDIQFGIFFQLFLFTSSYFLNTLRVSVLQIFNYKNIFYTKMTTSSFCQLFHLISQNPKIRWYVKSPHFYQSNVWCWWMNMSSCCFMLFDVFCFLQTVHADRVAINYFNKLCVV